LANIPSGGSIFRLVSAMQMERYGIRYVAGSVETPGYIECVRSGVRIRKETFYTLAHPDLLMKLYRRLNSEVWWQGLQMD